MDIDMKLQLAVFALGSLLACEGEPPILAPENAIGQGTLVAAPSASASAEAQPPAPVASACPPPPCAPVPPVPSSASSAAPAASEAPALPESPVSIPRGNI